MALPATCVHEVQTGGSDTANGGHFDPSNANMATNLAATSATGNSPVVSSASYTFAAGDVGAWLFVKAGTNWTPGWYQIASVNAGAATLSAAIGAALSTSYVANTVAGVATTASPTGGTWTIDYSQGTAAISLTGLTTAAANAIILTASATVAMVGNGIFVTGGTNFTTGVYNISSVSAGVSITVDRNCTTAAGAAGTAGVGGCLASPGFCSSLLVGGNIIWQKSGTYTLTSSTANISGGKVSASFSGGSATAVLFWGGYGTLRGDSGTAPVIHAGAITGITMFAVTSNAFTIYNISLNGNSGASNNGFNSTAIGNFIKCSVSNCPGTGLLSIGFTISCYASACGIGFDPSSNGSMYACVASSCTNIGFNTGGSTSRFDRCIAYSSTNDGFSVDNNGRYTNCVSYGNGRDGFRRAGGTLYTSAFINCIAVSNSGYGFNVDNGSAVQFGYMLNCSGYSNTSGNVNGTTMRFNVGFITLTVAPFTNAGSGDFSLNNTAGGGASCRAAGFPGVFPGGLTTGYLDIGAAQHQDAITQIGMIASRGADILE